MTVSAGLFLAFAIAIPLILAGGAWIASFADEGAVERRPKWKHFALLTLTVSLSLVFASFVAIFLRFAWSSGFTALSIAVILLLFGFGAGPVFTAVHVARPAGKVRIWKVQHLVQGSAYVGSGISYVLASFKDGWGFAVAGLAIAWLGIIRLYMASGRELKV